VLCAATLRIHYGPRNDGPDGITDERGFYVREARRAHPIVSVDFLHVPFAVDGMGLGELANSSRALEVTGSTTAAVAGPRGLLVDATDSPVRQRLPRGDVRFYPLTSSVPAGVHVVVGRWNVGLTGYFAGPRVHVVDRHGLADALAAHLRRQPGGRPGHDKILRNDWLVARFSTVEPSGPSRADVAAARHALQCRPLSDLFAAIQEPLTFRRFATNVKLAARLHRLRVPADPVAAERELCAGAGS
jgi:arabinofuranosyltransferase